MGATSPRTKISNAKIKVNQANPKKRVYNLRQQMPDFDRGPLFDFTFEALAMAACTSSEPGLSKEGNMNKIALYTKIKNSTDGIIPVSVEEQQVIESGLPFTPWNFPAATVAFNDLFEGKDVSVKPRTKNISAPDPRH